MAVPTTLTFSHLPVPCLLVTPQPGSDGGNSLCPANTSLLFVLRQTACGWRASGSLSKVCPEQVKGRSGTFLAILKHQEKLELHRAFSVDDQSTF